MAILVTGGTKGIGLAIARAFAEAGSVLYVNYAHDQQSADHAVATLQAAGARCRAIRADVGSAEGCAALIAEVERDGEHLDQLVHCAVSPYASPLLSADPEALTRAVQINGMALFHLVRAALPLMGQGSSVILLSSRGGRVVIPGYAAIGAGKALAECLMRYLAVELAPKGIRINAVAPAAVDTEALRAVFGERAEDVLADAARQNPSGRGIRDSDYIPLVRWLASDAAAYVQGQVIAVNGGANLMA